MSTIGFTSPPQGPSFKAKAPKSVWSPGMNTSTSTRSSNGEMSNVQQDEGDSSPVWQPFGAVPDEMPQFKSVKLETPTSRLLRNVNERYQESRPEENSVRKMTQKLESHSSSNNMTDFSTSNSSALGQLSTNNKLPQSQSPTIILLQKAREGQIPKGASYINNKEDTKRSLSHEEILADSKAEVERQKLNTFLSQDSSTAKSPPKYRGIGPTVRGIPVSLRTEVKDEYASDWYKTMYKSLHLFDKPDVDDFVTVKYRKKGNGFHSGGYMSEPELDKEDEPLFKYATVDHRLRHDRTYEISPNNHQTLSNNFYESKNIYVPTTQRSCQEVYRNQPKSITEYEPGHSSISEREEWMQKSKYLPTSDQPKPSYVYRDGYESDSTLFRKTIKPPNIDPQQQKVWYRKIQQGSDIPFSGLAKRAPERPKISPHKYQETEVNIHYRSPIRTLEKEYIEEEELRKRQEEAMRRFYEEESYKKYLQQLSEIEMRRHSDFFTPSQKSPIPLNRYDNPFDLNNIPPSKLLDSYNLARVLFNFTAQTSRELSLTKGEIINIIRKVDKNWYEGEHRGKIGIFPVKYVEFISTKTASQHPQKLIEGLAKVKYNFHAQNPLELSLFKGEKVVLIRKVDYNWYEGRIGNKKGIFPTSYIEIIREPGENVSSLTELTPSPIHDPVINGMHTNYTSQSLISNGQIPQCKQEEKNQPLTQSLHIDTSNESIPYRALYNYHPQNEDELELKENDTIYVMEKCDDGWFVGTSLRTGLFGTFPGNYVERM